MYIKFQTILLHNFHSVKAAIIINYIYLVYDILIYIIKNKYLPKVDIINLLKSFNFTNLSFYY